MSKLEIWLSNKSSEDVIAIKKHIDLHAHIIPDLDDDGPPDLESALAIAGELVKQGFETVIATPHCFEGTPTAAEVLDRCRLFQAALKQRGIPLRVLPGAELAIEPQLFKRIVNGQVMTLNGGRYLLIELPLFLDLPPYAERLFFELQARGYYLILAHPERIRAFQEDLLLLYRLVTRGIYTQLTLSSLTGFLGPTVKKIAWKMLTCRLVHFLATDAHDVEGRLSRTGPALKLLQKQAGAGVAETMLGERPMRLLHGEKLEVPEPLPVQKSSFRFINKQIPLTNRKKGIPPGRRISTVWVKE